jgi:hypothetical protein
MNQIPGLALQVNPNFKYAETVTAAPIPGSINAELAELTDTVSRLIEAVQVHEKRLDRILGPEMKGNADQAGSPQPIRCEIATEVCTQTQRIAGAINLLANLTQRVGI